MIQNIIFTLIFSSIFFYVLKSKKFGSPLLFIFTGLTFLHSFIYALDEYKREFLSNSIILNIIVLLGILLIRNKATVHEERNIKNTNTINKIFIIFVIFIFYHYLTIGIPYFSDTIGLSRFNLIKSGLFGIPSRLSVYGITILFILSILAFEYDLIKKGKFIYYISIILVFMIFQGNKSSILPIIFYSALCYPFIHNKKKVIFTYKNFLFFAIGSFIYFTLILNKINSIIFFNISEYLFTRSTEVAYDSGFFLRDKLSYDQVFLIFNNAIINDLIYPILILIGENVMTLNEQLSRALYGNFISKAVPVTPGWYAYHYFAFNGSTLLIYLHTFSFGMLVGYLENRSYKTNLLINKVILLTSVYWLWIGYAKGNPYYIIFNLLMCLLATYMIDNYFKKIKISK